MAKKSRNDFDSKQSRVKSYLLEHGNITSWEAIEKFNATRLSAIIFNIKKQGVKIRSEREEHEGVNWVRYYVVK